MNSSSHNAHADSAEHSHLETLQNINDAQELETELILQQLQRSKWLYPFAFLLQLSVLLKTAVADSAFTNEPVKAAILAISCTLTPVMLIALHRYWQCFNAIHLLWMLQFLGFLFATSMQRSLFLVESGTQPGPALAELGGVVMGCVFYCAVLGTSWIMKSLQILAVSVLVILLRDIECKENGQSVSSGGTVALLAVAALRARFEFSEERGQREFFVLYKFIKESLDNVHQILEALPIRFFVVGRHGAHPLLLFTNSTTRQELGLHSQSAFVEFAHAIKVTTNSKPSSPPPGPLHLTLGARSSLWEELTELLARARGSVAPLNTNSEHLLNFNFTLTNFSLRRGMPPPAAYAFASPSIEEKAARRQSGPLERNSLHVRSSLRNSRQSAYSDIKKRVSRASRDSAQLPSMVLAHFVVNCAAQVQQQQLSVPKSPRDKRSSISRSSNDAQLKHTQQQQQQQHHPQRKNSQEAPIAAVTAPRKNTLESINYTARKNSANPSSPRSRFSPDHNNANHRLSANQPLHPITEEHIKRVVEEGEENSHPSQEFMNARSEDSPDKSATSIRRLLGVQARYPLSGQAPQNDEDRLYDISLKSFTIRNENGCIVVMHERKDAAVRSAQDRRTVEMKRAVRAQLENIAECGWGSLGTDHAHFYTLFNAHRQLLNTLHMLQFEQSEVRCKSVAFPLLPLIEKCLANFASIAIQKNLDVLFSKQTQLEELHVRQDLERVQLVVQNLLAVFLELAHPHSEIEVLVREENADEFSLSVLYAYEADAGAAHDAALCALEYVVDRVHTHSHATFFSDSHDSPQAAALKVIQFLLGVLGPAARLNFTHQTNLHRLQLKCIFYRQLVAQYQHEQVLSVSPPKKKPIFTSSMTEKGFYDLSFQKLPVRTRLAWVQEVPTDERSASDEHYIKRMLDDAMDPRLIDNKR